MRKIRNTNYKKLLILISLVALLYISFTIPSKYGNKNVNFENPNDKTKRDFINDEIGSQGIVEDHYTEEWLKNPTFDPPVTEWYNTTEGDVSDVNASLNNDQANYEILGDSGEIKIDDPFDDTNWTRYNNPEFPVLPDTSQINSAGCYISHYWDESVNQTRNTPSVHWKRDIEMPVNMSDYIITSAKFEAIFNASVTVSPHDGGGIDRPGDSGLDAVATGDYAKFYVLLSDVAGSQEYQIAFNNTGELGRDNQGPGSPAVPSYSDTQMNIVLEDVLINLLTAVLDSDDYNFTITVGINVYCEDNEYGADEDSWDSLIIRSLNLTFTYEKKIDQFSSLSWNQVGNKITGDDVVISNGTLNFKYKIDQNWTESSPNSEIRIIITNRSYTETIKLSSANTSFQDAKLGGFDVTSLILKDENISVTIQVYLADTFGLGQKRIISIDNASLKITYTITTVEIETDFRLFLEGQNKTLGKSILVPLGDPVNITFKYTNTSQEFIPDATVRLTGANGPENLTENVSLEHYNITIDTKFFQIGDNFLTLSANKKYYEGIAIIVNIIISEIETNLDEIYLNQTLTKLIAFPYGDLLNITAVYREELSGNFIDGAAVQLLNGTDVLGTLDKHPTLNQYNLTINTTILGAEANTYTIFAKRDNYSAALESIITIIQRQTDLELKINSTDINNYDIYDLQVNQSIELVVTYKDYFTGDHIDNANVTLSGAGLSEDLNEDLPLEQYYITLYDTNLTKGFNFLTIIAQKENTMPQAISFSINVIERITALTLFINETDITTIKTYAIQIGETIDIIVNYTDTIAGVFIDNATVELTGGGFSVNLTEYSNQYKISINAENFTQAINYLKIIAEKKNYQPQPIEFRIDVIERQTISILFLNETSTASFGLILGEYINITVTYMDNKTGEFIDNAMVELTGDSFSIDVTKHPSLNQYTTIIDATYIGIGFKSLTITAQKTNYQVSSDVFTLSITTRQTYSIFFLNQINKTLDKSIELPIGADLNITFNYFDSKTDEFVGSALVQLVGTTQTWNLTELPLSYSLGINTRDLGIGVTFLTIVAGRPNYQSSSDILKITIRHIKTNITSEFGDIINIRAGGTFHLRITIYDLDFGGIITGATVRHSSALGQGVLIEDPENPGSYEIVFENVELGTYKFTITVSHEENPDYLFERKEITLSATISEEEALTLWFLLILAIISALVIGTYFIAYQRVLKFPKAVRKTRKYRRTLKKKKAPTFPITSREEAFFTTHQEGMVKVGKAKPIKPKPKPPVPEKKVKPIPKVKPPEKEVKPELKEKPPTPEEKVKPDLKEKPTTPEEKSKAKGKVRVKKGKTKEKEIPTDETIKKDE